MAFFQGGTKPQMQTEQQKYTPTVLHEGTISQDLPQWNNYFNRKLSLGLFTQLIDGKTRIVFYPYKEEQFLEGQLLPFDSQFNYADPWINLEGDYMLMQANIDEEGELSEDYNICESFYTEDGWTQPKAVKSLSELSGNEGSPAKTKNGSLYFNALTKEGDYNIYRLAKGSNEPEMLPTAINSPYFEGDFYIDQDEKFIIFTSSDRPDSKGGSDLYISFKENGRWTKAVALGEGINTDAEEMSPYVSMDRKSLVFTSNRNNPNSLVPSYNHFIVEFDLTETKSSRGEE